MIKSKKKVSGKMYVKQFGLKIVDVDVKPVFKPTY